MSTELIERPKPTLFQITQTLAEMFDMLETAEPEERDAITAEIDRVVACELATKVDGIVRFDRNTDCEVASLQALVSDIERKIGVLNGRKRQVREMTLRAMNSLGTKQLKGDIYTVSIRAGSESVDVVDEAVIPPVYFNKKESVQLDKAAVRSALKSGIEIPGVQMKRGDESLTVR